MSGDNYFSFPPPPPPPMQIYRMPSTNRPPPQTPQNWSSWSLEQKEFNETFGRPGSNYPKNRNYNNNRQQRVRYTPYNNAHTPWNRNNTQQYPQQYTQQYAQQRQPRKSTNATYEPTAKVSRKKKKPLSANMPKKEWTTEEAATVINLEREFNKRCGNSQLIIKFPDLELNRDIVSKFHSGIENVHFQQPSTPRFCFVTLKPTEDPATVIQEISKIPFGSGFLCAEYKKDREDDQNVTPDEIDPHTLYVGNLAQEVTKEEMLKKFPSCKRIDIGYAKKMKYTRYAFVTFRTVSDAMDAFKMSHNTQMYSKSLIVRFRRLHGTVGMPGETKTGKNDMPKTPEITRAPYDIATSPDKAPEVEKESSTEVDLSIVKTEVVNQYPRPFFDPVAHALDNHRPIKTEVFDEDDEDDSYPVKEENDDDDYEEPPSPTFDVRENLPVNPEISENTPIIKEENEAEDEDSSDDDMNSQESAFHKKLSRFENLH